MDKIDITMTATLRPKIVERTLISIVDKIIKDDKDRYKLIINIDPIGEKVKQKHIVSIARKYFSEVIFNYPENPSFAKAVKWVWKNSSANYIFHIEDDWEFTKKIDVDNMIRILDKYSDLSSLRLNITPIPNKKLLIEFSGGNWQYIDEDKFYINEISGKTLSLNPLLIKRKFIDDSLSCMIDNINPEKQFRLDQKFMVDVLTRWRYGIYTNPGDTPSIIDIGREWRKINNFKKPPTIFLSWITK